MSNIKTPKQLSPLQLAFYGDSVFEKLVRGHLIKKGDFKAGELHSKSTFYVCAKSQYIGAKAILDILNEEETAIFKRGRNAHTHTPKSASATEYSYATGLECLFGYLDLTNQDKRIIELFNLVIESIQ